MELHTAVLGTATWLELASDVISSGSGFMVPGLAFPWCASLLILRFRSLDLLSVGVGGWRRCMSHPWPAHRPRIRSYRLRRVGVFAGVADSWLLSGFPSVRPELAAEHSKSATGPPLFWKQEDGVRMIGPDAPTAKTCHALWPRGLRGLQDPGISW